MSAVENITRIKKELPAHVQLIAVSKTYPASTILDTYNAGHKVYGENKVQELVEKYNALPKDIEWHLIGHLQSNKVKYIAPFVSLIHSVDSLRLLEEINKCAKKNNRIINCLLQIHIAEEETKFGLSFLEAEQLLASTKFTSLTNCNVIGLMGMATNTNNQEQIRKEFRTLKNYFEQLKKLHEKINILSMGMSSDFELAIEEGSNMVRIGSTIFGNRH